MATVEIAIAAYNDARYLERTLGGLAAQTFRDFHVTLLDDGSTDDTLRVARSFAGRLSLEIIAAPHRGRQDAKAEVARISDGRAPFWMVLDSDIELPATALERTLAIFRARPEVGVVCARARSYEARRYGTGQAFIDDLFYETMQFPDGTCRWIVGGCAVFRKETLTGIVRRSDYLEDNDLSEQLRPRWRFVAPSDLQAVHYGVPTTLRGLWQRGIRDGFRVSALLRAVPSARSVGNVARLFPLPLALSGAVGLATLQPWLSALAGVGLASYTAAFVVASRRVPATLSQRLAGAAVFTFLNVGFGIGYAQETLRGFRAQTFDEPQRARSG